MIVRVRLFARLREQAGCETVEVAVPAGTTVAELRRALAQQVPTLAPLLAHVMLAINTEFATDTDVIPDNAEVACLPPVSGG